MALYIYCIIIWFFKKNIWITESPKYSCLKNPYTSLFSEEFRIYKEHLKHNNRQTTKIKNRQITVSDISSKKLYKWPTYTWEDD